MYAQVEKKKENISRGRKNGVYQKKSNVMTANPFLDNRVKADNHSTKESLNQCCVSNHSSKLKRVNTKNNISFGNLSSQSKVIQRQCDNCPNIFCNDGDKCGGRVRKYQPGEHGFKKNEQKLLTEKFGMKVTGNNFESEHTVGFEPINQTSGQKRGSSGRAHDLEYSAPAYQEYKPFHREHIGTGTSLTPDQSGFNSHTYRDSQRTLMESGDISSAVQINQLGYAHNPNFRGGQDSKEMEIANNSFNTMVGGMKDFTYANGANNQVIHVSAEQQVEMYLSREAINTGKWPTPQRISEVRVMFGLNP